MAAQIGGLAWFTFLREAYVSLGQYFLLRFSKTIMRARPNGKLWDHAYPVFTKN